MFGIGFKPKMVEIVLWLGGIIGVLITCTLLSKDQYML